MATAGKSKKILKPSTMDDNMDTNDVASIIDETIPITIFDDSENELDNTRDQTSKQKEKPKNPPPSRLPLITRSHRTEPIDEEMITDPTSNVNKASTSSNLQSWERPKYTTDADAKFINTTYKMVNGLAGNLKTEHKRDVLKSLSIAEAMYKEVLILRKRLAESIKRKRDVLEESDIDIMEFDNIDSSATEPTNFKKEIIEMKSAISKLTMLVQNNINLASTSTPRPSKQQQPQKTFSEVIKQHSANKTPIHRTIVSIPGNEDSEITQQMLTTRIVPVNEGINIVDSRKLSKGKVAIDFTSPESLLKFENKIASTSDLTHEPPRIMNPMMIIKGASSRIEKEQLPNMIKPFNHLISDFITKNNLNIENEILPVYVRPNRKPGLRNFAVRVNPKLRDIIIHQMKNKIIIDYQTTHIEDMTPVMQCYKCYGYNHKISECQVPDQMCLHCGDFHSFNQCPRKSSPAICLNCIRSNITNATPHNSVNRECPVHIRLLSRVINKIQY